MSKSLGTLSAMRGFQFLLFGFAYGRLFASILLFPPADHKDALYVFIFLSLILVVEFLKRFVK